MAYRARYFRKEEECVNSADPVGGNPTLHVGSPHVGSPPPTTPGAPPVTINASSTPPTPPLKSTPFGVKFLLSIILIAPRVGIGSVFLTSGIVKGVIAGVTIGAAKTGLLRGKSTAVENFGHRVLLETRRDTAKGLMLSFAGILTPVARVYEGWTRLEQLTEKNQTVSSGKEIGWDKGHIGSLDPKRGFQWIGAGLHDLIYSKEAQTELKNTPPHTWKKIDRVGVAIADLLTHNVGLQRALVKGSDWDKGELVKAEFLQLLQLILGMRGNG